MTNNKFNCLERCPYVWDCLATGEYAGMQLARIDQLAVNLMLQSVEFEGMHNQIIEDKLPIAEEQLKKSGDETTLAEFEKLKNKEAELYSARKERESWKEGRIAETREMVAQECDESFQDAEDAMASCLSGPQIVKRWRLFGRKMIVCTSPIREKYVYRLLEK